MAETIGLIASVIQVAGAGLKLSQTLYEYADGVNSADRRIKDIAKEVQLTSFVIDELASIFKNDDSSNLLSENAIKTADETVRECSSVFTELDAALKKTKKSALGKFKFPFRETKIELLRNQIDKLKSTLQLLMQVLTLAHQKASQKLDREAEAAQREHIKALLQSKKDSTERYEESLRNHKFSDDEESDKENEAPASISDSVTIASVKSSVTVDTLATCVQHVRSLLEDIESLQKVLSDDAEGKDSSEHHQSLVGSYFRARGHLDSILLGNPDHSMSSMTSSINKSEVAIGMTKTLSGITLQGAESRSSTEVVVQSARDSSSSLRPILTEAEFQKAILEAQERARKEEREKLQLEARNRAEREELAVRKEAEEKRRKDMELQRKNIEKELESAKREAREELEAAKVTAIEAEARAAKEAAQRADRAKPPLKLTDAVGRKFNLPFHLCKTWQDFHKLMTQAFLPIDNMMSLVSDGRYYIYGPEGEVIMPECWDSVIQPGWTIEMKLWDSANHSPSKSVNDTMGLLPQSDRPGRPGKPANPPAAPAALPKLTVEEEVYQAPYYERFSDISDGSVLTVSNPWNLFAPTGEESQPYSPFAPTVQSNKETDGGDENPQRLRTDLIDDFPAKMDSWGFNDETPVRNILQEYKKGRSIPLSDFRYVAWICYEAPEATGKRTNWQERMLRPSDAALTVYLDLEKKGYKPRFAITNGTPTKLECYGTLRRVIRKEILANREQQQKEGLSGSVYAELETRRMELRRMEDQIYEAWHEESLLQRGEKNEKLETRKTNIMKNDGERRPTAKTAGYLAYGPTLYQNETTPQQYPSARTHLPYGTYPSRPPPSLPAYSHLPPAPPPHWPQSYDPYNSAPSSGYGSSYPLRDSSSTPRYSFAPLSLTSPPRSMAVEPMARRPISYTSSSPPPRPSSSAITSTPQQAPDPLFRRATAPPPDRYSRAPHNRRHSLILSSLRSGSSNREDSIVTNPVGRPAVVYNTTAPASRPEYNANSASFFSPQSSPSRPEQAQNVQDSPYLHWAYGQAPKETHKSSVDGDWDYTVLMRRARPHWSRTYGAEEPMSLYTGYGNIDPESEKRDEGDAKNSKMDDKPESREQVKKVGNDYRPSTKPVQSHDEGVGQLKRTTTLPSSTTIGQHTELTLALEPECHLYIDPPNTLQKSDDEVEPQTVPISAPTKRHVTPESGSRGASPGRAEQRRVGDAKEDADGRKDEPSAKATNEDGGKGEEQREGEGEGDGNPSDTGAFVSPGRKVGKKRKGKKQKMSLADFMEDSGSAMGSWADEMEDVPARTPSDGPLPRVGLDVAVAQARRRPSAGARDFGIWERKGPKDERLDATPKQKGRGRRGFTSRHGERSMGECKPKPWDKPWRSVDGSKEDAKGARPPPKHHATPEGLLERPAAKATNQKGSKGEERREGVVVHGASDSHAAETRGEESGDEVDELLREWTTVVL